MILAEWNELERADAGSNVFEIEEQHADKVDILEELLQSCKDILEQILESANSISTKIGGFSANSLHDKVRLATLLHF